MTPIRTLVELALKRPVATVACFVLAGALAVLAWIRIPVALLPDLRMPTLFVWTACPDTPAARVERRVTESVEDAVGATPGLRQTTGRSATGGSLLRLDFDWSTDLDLALLEVRGKLDRLRGTLPPEAGRPLVLQLDPSRHPIFLLTLTATGEHGGGEGLKTIGRDVLARRLEQLEGVARVRLTGGRQPLVEIRLDPHKLLAYDLGVESVARALEEVNLTMSGRTVRHGEFRYAVEVGGAFRGLDDIAETPIPRPDAPPIRLRDVAEVGERYAERRGLVRLDGEDAVLLSVEGRPDANTVRTAGAVRRVLAELERELPGVRIHPVVDESSLITAAIRGVFQAILLGGLLAVAVVLAFLRQPRAVTSVVITVPLSLAITLTLFDLLSIDFNLLSLGGLALGIGMLVDNAIVVTENVIRLQTLGESPRNAARQGTLEVAPAITVSTLTTLVVFLPLTLLEGWAGRLFRDLAVAVTCSLSASLLVALTAVPLITAGARSALAPRAPAMSGSALYEALLRRCLLRPTPVLLAVFLVVGVAGWWATRLPREALPRIEQDRLAVELRHPGESDLPLLASSARRLERELLHRPEVRHLLAELGERDDAQLDFEPRGRHEGELTVLLSPGGDAKALTAELAQALPGIDPTVVSVHAVRTRLETILAPEGAQLFVDIVSRDREKASTSAEDLMVALRSRPQLINVGLFNDDWLTNYQLRLDHHALLRFGVSPSAVMTHLRSLTQGHQVGWLHAIQNEAPLVLRLPAPATLSELLEQPMPGTRNRFPLKSFVTAEPIRQPASLLRVAQVSVVRVVADLAPGYDLAAATAAVRESLKDSLPPPVQATIRGANENFYLALNAAGRSLLLSVALVYLILCAHFESLLQPLVVLLAVPLSLAGAVFALALSGHSVNLMSLLGGVVLAGIVVNDAIVKLDCTRRYRQAGRSLREALEAAGRDRFRPILITSFTTVLGLLPLTLGASPGARLRAPLAVAVIGGLLCATTMTLIAVPIAYLQLDRLKNAVLRRVRVRRARFHELDPPNVRMVSD